MEFFGSYTGFDFLVFYCVMLATCVFAGVWIAEALREPGREREVEDLEEVAVLSGGMVRYAMALSSDLMARKGLTAASRGKLRVNDADIETGHAGQSILRKIGEFGLRELKVSVAADASRVEARLIQRGLMMDKAGRMKLRLLSITPYAALLVIGLYRWQAGSALGEPTTFLAILLLLTAIAAGIRFFKYNARTMAGNAVLRDLEASASRLKRAPVATEAGFAVALFGTAVLVGTPWEPVHAMRQSGGGDSGYGGEGDSDGGGGCGGGGCGGCGG